MDPFTIIQNYRRLQEAEENESADSQAQRRKYKSSTKNNIHHFGAIIKKILWKAQQNKEISSVEVKKAIAYLQVATSMQSFAKAFSLKNVANVLKKSVDSGLFGRYLLMSDIGGTGKIEAMKYLNALFNAFETGTLRRWVIENDNEELANELQNGVTSDSIISENVSESVSKGYFTEIIVQQNQVEPIKSIVDMPTWNMFSDFDLDFKLYQLEPEQNSLLDNSDIMN